MNISAKSGSAITEINKMVNSRSNRLSADEKQVLIQMSKLLDSSDTVQSICSSA